MTYFTMSSKELDQIGIFEKLRVSEISQGTAAAALGISTRQVRRKLKQYRRDGPTSLVHAARGTPSNRQLPLERCREAIRLVDEYYSDFGPTFAAEKLAEIHGLVIGKETLRGLMVTAGLWTPKIQKQGVVHVWRARRAARGELIQFDGSYHDWFEGRGPRCCLVAFIDDATSDVLWAEFVESESTDSLLQATWHYFEREGRPISMYADRGGVYKVNSHNQDDDRVTQFGRALSELSVELIHARSPQAKGRIERLFGTLQDRLVKELRLKGISTMEEANVFLKDTYLSLHNAQFAVLPKEPADLHRSLEGYDLAAVLCSKETRVLQSDWCLLYQNRFLQLDRKQSLILSKQEKITLSHYLDGTLHLTLRGVRLSFTELLERPAKPARTTVPTLPRLPQRPPANHPWRHFNVSTKPDISKWLEPDISILA